RHRGRCCRAAPAGHGAAPGGRPGWRDRAGSSRATGPGRDGNPPGRRVDGRGRTVRRPGGVVRGPATPELAAGSWIILVGGCAGDLFRLSDLARGSRRRTEDGGRRAEDGGRRSKTQDRRDTLFFFPPSSVLRPPSFFRRPPSFPPKFFDRG